MRHKQLRPEYRSITPARQLEMEVARRKYRVQQYSQLLKLGLSESLADKALAIWTNGVKSQKDEQVLDAVTEFLDKAARRTLATTKKAAVRRPVRLAA